VNILLLDIETAPNLVHVWGLFQQNVAVNQIQASGYVLCWSAKWYRESEVMFDSVHQSKPKKMLKGIHKLLDRADMVVHYNGKKFDIPTLNKEFVLQAMLPPAPYKQVDLLQTARGQFKFTSNKLDFVARALGLGSKSKHAGHELWIKCMAGDDEAWKVMEAYNRQDVALLEKLYDRLLPWIKAHPNHGVYDTPGIPVCPNCGHHHLHRRGYARTLANVYARYQCMNCGYWTREPFSELAREDRGIIMRAAT
jgi:hypothetical protein